MASAYDYVQIVADNDWELLGIVPKIGGPVKAKRMIENNRKTYRNPYDDLPNLPDKSDKPVKKPVENTEITNPIDKDLNELLPELPSNFVPINLKDKRKDNVLVGFGEI